MQLERITVNRQNHYSYTTRNNIEVLNGTVEFSGKLGKITINFDEKTSQKVFDLFADELARIAGEAALEMKASIIDSKTLQITS